MPASVKKAATPTMVKRAATPSNDNKKPTGVIVRRFLARQGLLRLSGHRRRSCHRMMCSREYRRLRAMVPSIALKPKVSKVTVIEETIKYIDELHGALLQRLQAKGMPESLQSLVDLQKVQRLTGNQVRDLVQQLLPGDHFSQPPTPPVCPPVCQRNRRQATFTYRALK